MCYLQRKRQFELESTIPLTIIHHAQRVAFPYTLSAITLCTQWQYLPHKHISRYSIYYYLHLKLFRYFHFIRSVHSPSILFRSSWLPRIAWLLFLDRLPSLIPPQTHKSWNTHIIITCCVYSFLCSSNVCTIKIQHFSWSIELKRIFHCHKLFLLLLFCVVPKLLLPLLLHTHTTVIVRGIQSA